MVGISIHTYAQTQVLQRKINVPAKKITIEMLGNIISRQAGLVFSFDANKINGSNMVQLTKNSYTVEELLSLIKGTFNTQYRIYGDHVIFNRQRSQPVVAKITSTEAPPKNTTIRKTGNVLKSTAAVKIITDKSTSHKPSVKTNSHARTASPISDDTQQPVIVKIPLTSLPTPANVNVGSTNRYTPSLTTPWVSSPFTPEKEANTTGNKTAIMEADSRPNAPARPRRERRRLLNNPWTRYAAAGLTVDENLFFTPTVKVGIPYLYAIAAYSSNFRIGGFRYGLGAQLPVADNWNIQLNATTGKLSQIKSIDSSTMIVSVDLRGKHHIVALVAERKINERLTVQAGISYNRIQYQYYQNGRNVPLDSIQFPLSMYAGESIFRYFKPLVEISNDFSKNKPGYNQSWIGFQIGVYYRFR
ncbi:hypothetical protein CK934_10820 [Chitinophaga sp. MD30]|nr:hypothetical protein CK934_10820 [Chitinophaga sp. MD30]